MIIPPDVAEWLDRDVPEPEKTAVRGLIGNSGVVCQFVLLLHSESVTRQKLLDLVGGGDSFHGLGALDQITKIVEGFVRHKLSKAIAGVLLNFNASHENVVDSVLKNLPFDTRRSLSPYIEL